MVNRQNQVSVEQMFFVLIVLVFQCLKTSLYFLIQVLFFSLSFAHHRKLVINTSVLALGQSSQVGFGILAWIWRHSLIFPGPLPKLRSCSSVIPYVFSFQVLRQPFGVAQISFIHYWNAQTEPSAYTVWFCGSVLCPISTRGSDVKLMNASLNPKGHHLMVPGEMHLENLSLSPQLHG